MYFGVYRRKRQLRRSVRIERTDRPLRLTVITCVIISAGFNSNVVRILAANCVSATCSVIIAIGALEGAPQQGTAAQFCCVIGVVSVLAIIDEQWTHGRITSALD